MAKTRLNNDSRQAILESVRQALPSVSYLQSRLHARARELFTDILPVDVRKVWDNPDLRWYIDTEYVYLDVGGNLKVPAYAEQVLRSKVPENSRIASRNLVSAFLSLDADFVVLEHLYKDQSAKNDKAIAELKVALYHRLTTVEGFIEAFPELASHAPKVANIAVANLPVTTSVMDALKAAGLPLPGDTNPA